MADNDNNNTWQLDKKVPLVFVLGFLIQFIGFVWWTAKIDFQVQQNKKDIETMYVVQTKVIAMEAIFSNMLEEIRQLRKDVRALDKQRQ